MLASLVNFFTGTGTTTQTPKTTEIKRTKSSNPFSANPFVTSSESYSNTPNYGKNMPIKGGYFAGYYNGKPNIVGSRLFIEA